MATKPTPPSPARDKVRAVVPKLIDLTEKVASVRRAAKVPVVIGFGVSTPAQAAALGGLADGVVVGSAIVQRVARLKGPALIKEVGDFIAVLKAPLRGK